MTFAEDKIYNYGAEVIKALGHPIRLKIVAGLCTNECSVKHVWESLGLPQSTVSQHLTILKHAGIVDGHREGVEVHYSVISEFATKIINCL